MEGLMMIVTSIAEAVRFELTIPFGMPPFQGGGINHYPTPPRWKQIVKSALVPLYSIFETAAPSRWLEK